MSRKFIELILFYLLVISCIIIVSGLSFEGVRSGKAGKAPVDDEDTDEFFRTQLKTGAKNVKEESTSSTALNETGTTLGNVKVTELGDVLDNICQNLAVSDLTNFRAVCKEWRMVASRNMLYRGVDGTVLPHIYSAALENVDKHFHINHVLRLKPYVALLFVSPSVRERNCQQSETLEYDVLEMYRRYFPEYLVTLGVDRTMLDDHIINSCHSHLGTPNGILGLFVPSHSTLEIKVSRCTVWHNDEIKTCANQIIDGLMPVHSSRKTVLIMFATTDFGLIVARQVLASVKERYIQKQFTLWGGSVTNVLKTINNKTEDGFDMYSETFFAMSITGSNLKSWSRIIDCTLPRQTIDEQLLDFRNNVEQKGNTIGLIYGPQNILGRNRRSIPTTYGDNIQIMEAVKRVFPKIPFEAVFNYINHTSFGVNSMIDDTNQQLYSRMSLSIMILSHD